MFVSTIGVFQKNKCGDANSIPQRSVYKDINGCIFIEKYDRLAWVGQDMSRSGFEMFLIYIGLTKFRYLYFPELNSCANTEFVQK